MVFPNKKVKQIQDSALEVYKKMAVELLPIFDARSDRSEHFANIGERSNSATVMYVGDGKYIVTTYNVVDTGSDPQAA